MKEQDNRTISMFSQTGKISSTFSLLAVGLMTVCLAFAAAGFTNKASAETQENSTVYLQIDYYAVQPGQQQDFVTLMDELWKPVQQKRMEQGDITAWHVYDALVTGYTADYQFVTITTTDDFSALYGELQDELVAAVHTGDDPETLKKQMYDGFTRVNSEIWSMDGAALPEGASGPEGKYITKNYMDARDASGEHEAMELDFWKPIHYVRIDQDILNSWVMYSMVKPGGASREYTYSTIDYYDRLGDIEGSVGMELARIAHPDLTDDELSDYFARTSESRTAYKTEMWREVVSAGKPN
ncbi:hypothetical protein [Natronogracilivirga saccharolytica]|nr:hypothetical protein [Natronogracilivirga saccharolytica]